jgi:hypothetical protein
MKSAQVKPYHQILIYGYLQAQFADFFQPALWMPGEECK